MDEESSAGTFVDALVAAMTTGEAKQIGGDGLPGKAILTKFSRIMGSLNGLKKDGKNTHHKFNFVSHDQVMKGTRKAFIEEGIVFVPRIDKHYKTGNSVFVEMTFTYFDSESGESFSSSWVGEGQDSQDKGIYKAITQCVKTQLLKILLIPSGDEYTDGDYGIGYDKAKPGPGKSIIAQPKESGIPETPGTVEDIIDQIKATIKARGIKAKESRAIAEELKMPVSRSWPDFHKFTAQQAMEYLIRLEKKE